MRPSPSYVKSAKRPFMFMRWVDVPRHDGRPYLRRLVLFACPWFAVYLHFWLGADDSCPHDHPFGFVSVILWGGYVEYSSYVPAEERFLVAAEYPPGSVLFRPAVWIHRVCPTGTYSMSLVIRGPKTRAWGFHTPGGFVPWQQYDHAIHCDDVLG
jgi:hypothetical protein